MDVNSLTADYTDQLNKIQILKQKMRRNQAVIIGYSIGTVAAAGFVAFKLLNRHTETEED